MFSFAGAENLGVHPFGSLQLELGMTRNFPAEVRLLV